MTKQNIIHEIRQKNLETLIASGYRTEDIAEKAKINHVYLRQCLSRTSSMGMNVASKIERSLGLPAGWMSLEHGKQKVAEEKAEYLTINSITEKLVDFSTDELNELTRRIKIIITSREQ